MTTRFRLIEIGLPTDASRGLKESIVPIDGASQTRRTINGILRDVSNPNFRKYKLTITGDDMASFPLDGTYNGEIVTVHCLTEFRVEGTLPDPASSWSGNTRPIVSGSLRQAGAFIAYRPVLTCMVVDFGAETDEYGAVVSWTLTLEEV